MIDLDRDDLDDIMTNNLHHLFAQAAKKQLASTGQASPSAADKEDKAYSISFSQLCNEDHQNATQPAICDDQHLHSDCLCLPAESASASPANHMEQHGDCPESAALPQNINDCSFEAPSWEELKKPMVELLLKYYNGED